jgi:hypothetical protein
MQDRSIRNKIIILLECVNNLFRKTLQLNPPSAILSQFRGVAIEGVGKGYWSH